jgi:lipooligosaccharide transport system permease protein
MGLATTSMRAARPTSGARRVYEHLFLRYRRTWRGSLASTFLNPLLFLGSLGFGLGHFVDRNGTLAALGGVSYVSFLAPGLLTTTAMQVGMGEAAWPVLGAVLWTKDYIAMVNTPLRVVDLLVGHMTYIVVRLVMATTAFLVTMALFGTIHSPLGVLAGPAAVLTGMAFVTPLAAFSVTRRDDSSFSVVFRFVMTPLFLFSGTFFPISQLPRAIRPVALVLPLWHGVDLARMLTLGHVRAAAAVVHVAVLLAYIGVGLLLAAHEYHRRLVR